jgi:hypothetical protein
MEKAREALKKILKALRDPAHKTLRKRIVAVALVVVMVPALLLAGVELGRSGAADSAGAGVGSQADTQADSQADDLVPAADGTVPTVTDPLPTGAETVENPDGDYSCARGGLFSFAGWDFVAGATVNVHTAESDEALGSFLVDSDGSISSGSDEPFPSVAIPDSSVPGTLSLAFDYSNGKPAATLDIEVTANPYTAEIEIVRDTATDTALLRVFSSDGLWAPDCEVYLTIDYASSPIYGPAQADAAGNINATSALPTELSGTGTHTFTLSAAETIVDGVSYPEASLSKELML